MQKVLCIVFIVTIGFAYAAQQDKNLQRYLNENPGKSVPIWIFFNDKGPQNELNFSKTIQKISERAIKRRSKVDSRNIIRFSDYPVYTSYVDQIKPYIQKIFTKSSWLNAVSAEVEPSQIGKISGLDFVKEIRLQHTFKRKKIDDNNSFKKSNTLNADIPGYGRSSIQLEQIGVSDLHKKGLTGKGVVIAMLDDGFNRYKTHRTFDSLKVLDTYDFIYNDTSVDDPDSIPTQGWHGTWVLSTLAGFTPDTLIGPAYGASYLLAKTEIDAQEIQQEEYNWVAGLEWAEANGADIINSSLGYSDWYTWQDMDGKTAITTIAANMAEEYGLIICNSAGNERYNKDHNTLNAPADGKYVITVGGVNTLGDRVSSSSVGPTVDGRIKPDIMAMGSGVYRASSSSDYQFSVASGTSMASPLVAGSIALLLEAFPELTPAEVRNAIKKTASQSSNPDNLMGYGILNISAAYDYVLNDTIFAPDNFFLAQNEPNPFNGFTRIKYGVRNESSVKLSIYDVLGRLVFAFPNKVVSGNASELITDSQLGATGVYFYTIAGKDLITGRTFNNSRKMVYIK